MPVSRSPGSLPIPAVSSLWCLAWSLQLSLSSSKALVSVPVYRVSWSPDNCRGGPKSAENHAIHVSRVNFSQRCFYCSA